MEVVNNMALNANASKNTGSGGSVSLVDPGTYPARLVAVVDLGKQAQPPYQGQEKPPVYKILVTYEFLDEFMKDEDGNDIPDKPRWMSETFPLYSLDSEKAKSTKRYNAVDPNHVHNGDWVALLGSACLITVVHNPGTGANTGKVFANIGNVSPMREKDAAKAPALVGEPLAFDLDNPDMEVFEQLPNWTQDKIKSNLEFPGSKLEKLLSNAPAKKPANEKAGREEDPVDQDETPY